jgi:O-antigen/teichoic acid export membrane protein
MMALVDQGMVSGASFVMIALIGRMLGAGDLGIYTLLFSLLLLATAVQDATVSTTFLTRAPELDRSVRPEYAGSCLLLSFGFSLICAGAGALAASHILGPSAGQLPDGGGAVVATVALLTPAFLMREQLRRYEFALFRMGSALALDTAAVGLQLGIVGVILLAGHLSLPTCLLALAVGHAAAAGGGLVRRRTEFVFSLKALRSAAQDVVTLSTWVLIALVLLVLALQVMPWLVAARLGIEVAGAYSACMALANVGNPLLTGVINTMMPKAAAAFAESGPDAVLPALGRDIAILLVVTSLVAFGTIAFAQDLLGLIFGPGYASYALLAALLTSAFFVRGLGAGAYIGCWALRRPECNAVINLGMIAIAVSVGLFSMPHLGVLGAGIGTLCADLFGATVRWIVVLRLHRTMAHVHT